MLANTIVHNVLKEIEGRSGLEIEGTVDEEIYEEIVETLIDLVQSLLDENLKEV